MINFNHEAFGSETPKKKSFEISQMSKEQILTMIERCQNTIKDLESQIATIRALPDMNPIAKAAKMANLMLEINVQESNIEYWQDGLEGK